MLMLTTVTSVVSMRCYTLTGSGSPPGYLCKYPAYAPLVGAIYGVSIAECRAQCDSQAHCAAMTGKTGNPCQRADCKCELCIGIDYFSTQKVCQLLLEGSYCTPLTTIKYGDGSDSINQMVTSCDGGGSSEPSPTPFEPCWSTHDGKYSGGYAGGISEQFSYSEAKKKCIDLGQSTCKAITCQADICTVRASSSLKDSPVGRDVTTYVPDASCSSTTTAAATTRASTTLTMTTTPMTAATHYKAVVSWASGASWASWGAFPTTSHGAQSRCFPKDATTSGEGFLFVSCCNLNGEGVTRACQNQKTHTEAVALCHSSGNRLCTEAEVLDGRTVSKGCGYDGPQHGSPTQMNLAWTSDVCEAQDATTATTTPTLSMTTMETTVATMTTAGLSTSTTTASVQAFTEHAIYAAIVVSDPTAFDVKTYEKAMTQAYDIDQIKVDAVITGFLVSVSYEFSQPVAGEMVATAIATSVGADKDNIDIKFTRRLAINTGLKFTVEAEIKAANATAAKTVKTKSTSATTLKLALARIGVSTEPRVKVPPSVTVKTLTMITSPGSTLQVLNGAKLAEVGTAVGGAVTLMYLTASPVSTGTVTMVSTSVASGSSVPTTTSTLSAVLSGVDRMAGPSIAVALIVHITSVALIFHTSQTWFVLSV